MSRLRLKSISSALLMLITTAVLAETFGGPVYDISWHSIDGGGGASGGGTYSLTASIGQPDDSTMSGGGYTLEGGFLAVPPGAACPADTDASGDVGIDDFLAVLAQWGLCPTTCSADTDNSGDVGIDDFLAVLAEWGPCP